MDIVAVAVAIVAPFIRDAGAVMAQRAGESAHNAVRNLYRAIRAKVAGDPQDAAALDHLQQSPDDARARKDLEDVLRSLVASDQLFASQLKELVGAASADETLVQFMTEIYGEAKVGQFVNIADAGTVNLGDVKFD